MPETRYNREFGTGTLLGDQADNFFGQPLEDQVREIGWSHACPVVDQVVKDYGPEWTLKRYSECNFVFGLIVESARDLNPDLYKKLTTPIPRLPNEPVGVFDLRFNPESHKTRMSPLSTLWGYALPRVAIEEMGRGENNKNRTQERMLKALDFIDQAVRESRSPIELVVKLSERVSHEDADPKAVLSHLLASGILHEENCKTMFKEILLEMEKSAPLLTEIYNSLSPEEKKKLGVGSV